MEVAFENTCNFKCLYCSPESSSRWQEEVTHHGPIGLTNFSLHDVKWLKSQGKLPIHRDEPNPYIDAFWKWWPTLYPKLHTFRITGGEPLLSKHTWAVLDYIKANPRADLTLAINTNMNVPKKLIDKLVEYVNDIAPHIKSFDIYTSAESTGAHAEYARSGMVYEEFKSNCLYFLNHTPVASRLYIMTTVNLMSATSFKNFLEEVSEWRKNHQITRHDFRVRFMISYLRWPKFLSLNLLSKADKEKYAKEWESYISNLVITDSSNDNQTFYIEELDQIKRLNDYMLTSIPEDETIYDDFRAFIVTCDERRNTNFDDTFPELSYLLDADYYGDL
jgi:organic radical activating enzyme